MELFRHFRPVISVICRNGKMYEYIHMCALLCVCKLLIWIANNNASFLLHLLLSIRVNVMR